MVPAEIMGAVLVAQGNGLFRHVKDAALLHDASRLLEGLRVRLGLGGATVRQETVSYCQAHPRIKNCGQALLTALQATPVTLDSERLSANVTATLFTDTDVTLSGDYYLYEQDPTQVAFFTLVAAGRGAGVPIAPLRYEVRPEVVHRFGDLSARLWFEAGEYVTGTGQSTAGVGLKLQYKFTKTFRSWVILSGQRDVDPGDLVHLKAFPNRLDPAERLEQRPEAIGCDAVHLDVDVLGVAAHQAVAHPPADDERASPLVADGMRNGDGAFEGRHRSPVRSGLRPKRFTRRSV